MARSLATLWSASDLSAPQGRPLHMLHLRIMMRLGGCAASSQNTDADTGVGVVRCLTGWSIMRGPASLTSVCVQGDLKAFIYGQARRVLETTFFGYRDV